MQVTFENLCMVYNGYTQTPAYFSALNCCRAVVPQSFSFDSGASLSWDIKHGNTHNPWTLPPGKTCSSIVGQLRQSGVNAKCDPAFHKSAFFKFCVNNAANLLSVIEDKCCTDLVCPPLGSCAHSRACVAVLRWHSCIQIAQGW
jgi:ketopantoate reductase